MTSLLSLGENVAPACGGPRNGRFPTMSWRCPKRSWRSPSDGAQHGARSEIRWTGSAGTSTRPGSQQMPASSRPVRKAEAYFRSGRARIRRWIPRPNVTYERRGFDFGTLDQPLRPTAHLRLFRKVGHQAAGSRAPRPLVPMAVVDRVPAAATHHDAPRVGVTCSQRTPNRRSERQR